MDRNIFSQGVVLAHGYLPEEAKNNKLFRLHFHVGDDYIPASSFDPPEHWRDYRKLDSVTFRVKFFAPKDAKNLIFYFFDQNYLGASEYCDEHV